MKCLLTVSVVLFTIIGCSSTDDSRMATNQKRIDELYTRIDEVVTDPVRGEAMKKIIADLDLKFRSHETSLEHQNDIIVAASANHDTTRQELEVLYATVSEEVREMMVSIKDAHLALKKQASPKEWEVISRGKKRLFNFN